MPSYICDLETNGFLDKPDLKIHCAVLQDIDSGEVLDFQFPLDTEDFLGCYAEADLIVGHNFIKFDYEVIKKLYGLAIPKDRIIDTMVLGRLIFPDIKQSDYTRARWWKVYHSRTEYGWDDGRYVHEAQKVGLMPDDPSPSEIAKFLKVIPAEFPGHMIGRHSLEAWGYRIGENKGDYSKDMKAKGLDPWASWNPEMHSYMIQDAEVTLNLYRRFMAREPSPQSVSLVMRIAWLCAQIERNGFPFNMEEAVKLYGRLCDEREALRRQLVALFPSWKVRLPDFIPKRNNKTKGYIAGEPVERWKDIEFNPGSRAHIIDRFKEKYGWKPTVFTQEAYTDEVTKEKVQPGSPKMDETVLATLPYPEAPSLARYFLLNKRIGQLAEGKEAWMKVAKDGKIHANYTINGAFTGRATHSKPNISQVPRVSSPFGRECRALFHVPKGWVQLGADQQGLELRCLGSDLDLLAGDQGNYSRVVTEGDVHTTNQEAAGLATRDKAKTFIYALVYGAGDPKIGSIADGDAKLGKKLKNRFIERTPGLKTLISKVREAAGRGWILGIDRRKLPIRGAHAALNTRLQNAGAVICCEWGASFDEQLQSLGLKHGWDGDYVVLSFSHDEYQLAVRDNQETIDTVKRVVVEAGRNAGIPYNFKCPLDVDTKQGANWAECH